MKRNIDSTLEDDINNKRHRKAIEQPVTTLEDKAIQQLVALVDKPIQQPVTTTLEDKAAEKPTVTALEDKAAGIPIQQLSRALETGTVKEETERVCRMQDCGQKGVAQPISAFGFSYGVRLTQCKKCSNKAERARSAVRVKQRKAEAKPIPLTKTCVVNGCSSDGKEQPISNFYVNRNQLDGHQSACKPCVKVRTLRRTRLLACILLLWKFGKSCVLCGEADDTVFENDHINPEEKAVNNHGTTMAFGTVGLPNIVTELKKTRILCTMCHADVSHQQRQAVPRSTKCNAVYKARHVAMRRQYVNSEKTKIGGCVKCGWWNDKQLHLLDFDHIDPSMKLGTICDMVRDLREIPMIAFEMKKCQLLCKKCHRKKTLADTEAHRYGGLGNFSAEEIGEAKRRLKAEGVHVEYKRAEVSVLVTVK